MPLYQKLLTNQLSEFEDKRKILKLNCFMVKLLFYVLFFFIMKTLSQFKVAFLNLEVEDNEWLQKALGAAVVYAAGKLEEARVDQLIDKYNLNERVSIALAWPLCLCYHSVLLQRVLQDPTLKAQD